MKALLVAALVAMATPSFAQQQLNAQSVRTVVPYETTCSSVTLTTSPTEVSGNTTVYGTSARVFSIKVVNLDSTHAVFCSDSSSVAASGNNIGDPIEPVASGQQNSVTWAINKFQKWYCIAAAANTSVIVCKSR